MSCPRVSTPHHALVLPVVCLADQPMEGLSADFEAGLGAEVYYVSTATSAEGVVLLASQGSERTAQERGIIILACFSSSDGGLTPVTSH